MLSGRRIVVVGGSGFIGTQLVQRLLSAGNVVRIADKVCSKVYPDIWVSCDVRDLESVIAGCQGFDVIYNLAAEHRDDVKPQALYNQVNIDGAENVCAAAAALRIPTIVFTSSVAVYGFSSKECDEDSSTKPFNEYGRSKLAAERIYQEWAEGADDRSVMIARLTATFGKGNRGNVHNLISHIAKKHFMMVGHGQNMKSIAYVENVAAFLEYILDLGTGSHILNYTDKPDYDMNTLVQQIKVRLGQNERSAIRIPFPIAYAGAFVLDGIARIIRRNLPISRIRVRKFCENSQFSARRARAVGFVPPYSLSEALNRFLRDEFGGTDEFCVATKRPAVVIQEPS